MKEKNIVNLVMIIIFLIIFISFPILVVESQYQKSREEFIKFTTKIEVEMKRYEIKSIADQVGYKKYQGTKFSNVLVGYSYGPSLYTFTSINEEYFVDVDSKEYNLNQIAGFSYYYSGVVAAGKGIQGGGYKFGHLEGTNKTPGIAIGFDLSVDAMVGSTKTIDSVMQFDKSIFPENRGNIP